MKRLGWYWNKKKIHKDYWMDLKIIFIFAWYTFLHSGSTHPLCFPDWSLCFDSSDLQSEAEFKLGVKDRRQITLYQWQELGSPQEAAWWSQGTTAKGTGQVEKETSSQGLEQKTCFVLLLYRMSVLLLRKWDYPFKSKHPSLLVGKWSALTVFLFWARK